MGDAILNFLNLHTYFGLDWAAAVFMFLSMHRLGTHHKDGFVFAALASLCWVAFNVLADSRAGIIANIIIGAMALRSLILWHANPPAHKPHDPLDPDDPPDQSGPSDEPPTS